MMRTLAVVLCVALLIAVWLARSAPRAARDHAAAQAAAAEATEEPALLPVPSRAVAAGGRERPPAGEPAAKQGAVLEAHAAPAKVDAEGTTLFFGRAVDGRSGLPLAHAHAEVRNGPLVFDGGDLPPTVLVPAESSAGADGVFRLEYVDAGVAMFLLLSSSGYGPRRFLLESGHETQAEACVLELQPCASLEIRVRDGEGAPLDGTSIELAESATSVSRRNVRAFVKGSVWRATTDEGGRAFLPCVPAGVLLQLGFPTERSTRMRFALQPGERREIELIAGFAVLRGLVLDDAGSPVAHYGLELTRPHPDAHASGSFTDAKTTDAFGRFEFPAVAFGEWQLGASYGPWSRVLIDRPVVEVEHRAVRGKALAGRVTREDGGDGDAGSVAVYARSVGAPRVVLDAWTHDDGEVVRFDLYEVPPGEYDVYAWEPGGGSGIVRAAAGDEEIELLLPAKVALTVLTPGFTGEGELCVLDRARGWSFSTSIGRGSSKLPFGPGEYALRVTTPDGRIGFEPALVVTRAGAPAVVQLDVQPGAVLGFTLGSASGERTLRLFAGGGLFEERAVVPGESGTLLVSAGALVVELLEHEQVVSRQGFELAAGERRRIELGER